MTMKFRCGFIFICSLLSIGASGAQWDTPPFIAPDDIDSAVKFIESTTEQTRIDLQEEVDHDVCIAEVNYEGTTIPQIGRFSSEQSNYILGAEFRRNTTTGRWLLYITKKQDYETPMMQKYRFEVVINSQHNDIALNILNIDDNAPVIQVLDRNCSVEENYSGRMNCTFQISDADGSINQTIITFTPTPEEGSENFAFTRELISNNEYEMKAYLNVTNPLDYETIATYMLQIKGTDDGRNEGNLMTIIQVIDMPDEPPVWMSIKASENIIEKTENEFQVLAKDGDRQIDAEINYRIVPEDPSEANLFSVEEHTGLITIHPIDRDTLKKEIFRFSIIAYEKGDMSSAINSTIVLVVEDQNDHSPVVTPDVLSIDIEEETYMTLNFDQPITINDPDLAENGQYTVELIDHSDYNWSSAFLIVPNSGYQSGNFTISVLDAPVLDYEDPNWRNIEIEIQAIEVANKSHVGRKVITINLINLNDEVPIFLNDSVEVDLPEDIAKGHPIATMLATDRDVDDNVVHALSSQKALTINETTGEIETAVENALDYESMPVVVVQVVASDLGQHKTYATVTINVIDVNDVPPQLFLPKDPPSLIEEEPIGTNVSAKIEASDVDTDAELSFSIDWDRTTAQKSGVLATESSYREHLDIVASYPEGHKRYAEGQIVIKDRIDYEAFDVMFLTIVVHDTKTVHNDNSTSASLTLNIIDINDNSPFFNKVEELSIPENSLNDVLIGSVTATDADGPQWNKITYSIQPTNETGDYLISINETTGIIRVNTSKGIDAEVYEFIHYEVIASDGDNDASQLISIYVIDVNDEVPYLQTEEFNSTIHIREKSPSGTEIVTISGNDRDRTSPFNNISYLMNTNYSAPLQYFDINRFSGYIQVNLTDEHILDRDTGPSTYTINLKLRDNYLEDGITWNTNAIDTTITVVLDDINDQPPKLPDYGDPATEVNENMKKDARILSVTAEDKDDPTTNNTKVSYRVLNVLLIDEDDEVEKNCQDLFNVETEELKTAMISAARDLKGCYGNWAIELYAQDHGTDPGPLNDTRIYKIKITDFNYYDPEIIYPVSGTSIALSQDQTLHTKLKTHDKQPLPDFKATDRDYGSSGTVSFSISSTHGDDQYFEIIETEKNSAQLQLKSWPSNIEVNDRYTITLTATDGGDPGKSVSQDHTIIFVSTLGPKFDDNDWTVWIKENKTGLNFSVIIPEAFDNINVGGSNVVPIYYFIDNKIGDFEYFSLEKEARNLTVIEELDREKQEIMMITVITTADSEGPPRDPRPEAILNITIIVLDENDNSPVFESKSYSGGVAAEDNLDKLIVTVKATDADLNDTLSYSLNEDSLTASDSSISNIKNPFSLDSSTGELVLKFSPTSNMNGFFKIEVSAYDAVNHSDKTSVQIYIVSNSNRVVFTFKNNAAYVTEERMFIIRAFSDTFGYICNIDDIKSSVDSHNHVMDNVTTITTHFIDSKDNLPIEADVIILASSDLQTVTNLKAHLQTKALYLIDVPTGSASVDNDNGDKIYWLLVSLTILFCLTTVALFIVHFIRTRNLNKRLEKMAVDWKSGDGDFGKEKNGIVPTTNQFAIAGSNPIWNIPKKSEFSDNVSRRSGDSDLIGIEENPDFGYVNDAFKSDEKYQTNGSDHRGAFPSAPVIYFDSGYKDNENEDKC